jgi:cellobiose phosphorylase
MTQFILGIRPTYRSIRVAPVIPPKWKGFTVKRIFQGVRYGIVVKREGNGNTVHLTVDGSAIDGNIIPKPDNGVTDVTVEVVLS